MLERFERMAVLYGHRYMRPIWQENGAGEDDPWLSLRLFLRMYAFERQGRSPDYAFAAVDAVDLNRSMPLNSASPSQVWSSFVRLLGDKRPNHANNPLCPKGTTYDRLFKRSKHQSTVKNLSAIEVAYEIVPSTLVGWARDHLQRRAVREAHERFCSINGVNHKIASFFLRDVAREFQLAPVSDRHLLQPIDVWIRFVVQTLAGDATMEDGDCAQWILERAADPEALNQGIWYFCADVAESSRYQVLQALKDPTFFDKLQSRHLKALQRSAEAVQAFQSVLESGGQCAI